MYRRSLATVLAGTVSAILGGLGATRSLDQNIVPVDWMRQPIRSHLSGRGDERRSRRAWARAKLREQRAESPHHDGMPRHHRHASRSIP